MSPLSQIALTLIHGLGSTTLRRLVELYPGQDIFALPPSELRQAFGSHRDIAESIISRSTFARAEEELRFCEKNHIRTLFFTDPAFPSRLNRPETADCPALLYVMGDLDLNHPHPVAIVGTRRATAAGRDATNLFVKQLASYEALIVSGLAYGIDTAAHSAALDHALPTAAVLGHGLDRIYPTANRPLARRIIEQGGALVTEYPSQTDINPSFFPARNRIIAALADATLVVEASDKGGALITAALANSYQREVFAVPGRIGDTYSRGTNALIATNRALLARNADDIAYQLGWKAAAQAADSDPTLFPTLSADEQRTLDLMRKHDFLTLDELAAIAEIPLPKAAALLFGLEMKKMVHTLPGHKYQVVMK